MELRKEKKVSLLRCKEKLDRTDGERERIVGHVVIPLAWYDKMLYLYITDMSIHREAKNHPLLMKTLIIITPLHFINWSGCSRVSPAVRK